MFGLWLFSRFTPPLNIDVCSGGRKAGTEWGKDGVMDGEDTNNTSNNNKILTTKTIQYDDTTATNHVDKTYLIFPWKGYASEIHGLTVYL